MVARDASATCDYSVPDTSACVAQGYPGARIPPNDLWRALGLHLAAAANLVEQSNVAGKSAQSAQKEAEKACSTFFKDYAPECRRQREKHSKLATEARAREMEAYYAINKVIEETIAAYGLHPAACSSGAGRDDPPVEWKPRYSEREVLDVQTGHWRRDSAKYPPKGELDDRGRLAIFHSAYEVVNARNQSDPDRLAATILHETIHWVDRKSFGGPFWTHEAHKTQVRAYRAEKELVQRIHDSTGRSVLSADEITGLDNKIIHHEDAPKHIPNKDNWIGIHPGYYAGRVYSKGPDRPRSEEDYSAEILKTKAGMDFALAWDRRASDLLERIGEYNTRLDEENRFRKEAQGQWRREQAFNRLSAFSAKVCSHGDGLERVMVPMQELEQIWVELGPETYGTDPDPFLGYWDCAVWLPRKLARLHAQGERCPDPNVLLALLQRHDEATEKVKRGDPVAAPPPPRAAPRIPPAVATPPSRQNSSTGVPVQNRPEPPERERCRYQGDWCR